MSRYISFDQNSGILSRHSSSFKELFGSHFNKLDLKGLLQLLNVTNDTDLLHKVFSALSINLMFNKEANIDVIIKCSVVYDKLHNVLSKGTPQKWAEALNFLSALLYIDADEGTTTKKRAVTLYACNMTRTSGCLSIMCELFVNCMMFHDTWKALCQCLAAACSECEINQSYCSHLIPVCIEKCGQANLDALLVLKSLLLNHNRNIQLFLNCNGVSIFSRDLLQYDKCLQLLTTVAQCPAATTLLQRTNVMTDLRGFLELYGPDSQLGRMAMIILNHISLSTKVVTENDNGQNCIASESKINTKLSENNFLDNIDDELEETKVLIQNVMKEIFNSKQRELQNLKEVDSQAGGVKVKQMFSKYKPQMHVSGTNERSKLINNITKQNYFEESNKPSFMDVQNKIQASYQNNKKLNKLQNNTSELNYKSRMYCNGPVPKGKKQDANTRKKQIHCNCDTRSELSFTFLQNNDFQVPKHKEQQSLRLRNEKPFTKMDDTQKNDTMFYKTISGSKSNIATITLEDFIPIYASTPKHKVCVNKIEATDKFCKTVETQTESDRYKTLKMKRGNAKRMLPIEKGIKNRSLSAKFFSAINDSCTTFVKTVKNIFNRKSSSNSASLSSTVSEKKINQKQNTYSFTNYMKKRDALLKTHWMKSKMIDRSDFSTATNSCNTCNDTEVLKHKITKDEFLKLTVKKLKMGINLYGCDFKKISKAMWPRDSYMTPLVLYNLYRKLLLK